MRNVFVSAVALAMVMSVGAGVLGGCKSAAKGEDESMCLKPKPGTIVSVNQYCAIMLSDPVDPSVTADWKGQKVGFCCAGCLPKWEKLSPAEKDAALATAVAKGKIPS